MITLRPVRYHAGTVIQSGFTLVELIAVIIIVGILATFASGRMMERSSFDSVAFADQAAALLRYGQKVAIAQNRNVYVRIQANGVALCYSAACSAANRVLAPGGANGDSKTTRSACGDATWACEAPPAQVTLTALPMFYFDALGKPFLATDGAAATVSTFGTSSLTVKAGSSSRSIAIEMETGYVH